MLLFEKLPFFNENMLLLHSWYEVIDFTQQFCFPTQYFF